MNKRALAKAVAAAAVVATAVIGYQAPQSVSTEQVAVTANGDVRGLIPDRPIEADQDKVTQAFKTQETDLRTVSTVDTADGSVVRQQQYIDGVKVFGGQIVQSRTKDGKLSSALGKVTKVGTDAGFPAGGEEKAKQVFPGQATSVERVWFDPTLAGKAGESRAVPAYHVKQEGGEAIVRASDNAPALSWATHQDVVNRVVCDAESKIMTSSQGKCGTTVPAGRWEGSEAHPQKDVNSVFDFFGETSALYARLDYDLTSQIGVDRGDGKGKALRGTVRECRAPSASGASNCPWRNATWDGSQMHFGEGVTTDDVTAHELTHGVTQHTSGLIYAAESGAINEALSDIFGEFMDQTNGSADDTAETKWRLAEGSSFTKAPDGAIRSMKRPEDFNHPSSYEGPGWKSTANPGPDNDQGGVHTNSGVANKLAYLIADGDTHNGETVRGLGLDKSLQLWWKTQNLLTESSNYSDLGRAITTACTSLAGAGVAGIDTADCAEVGKAVKAVKIG
ncbi:M4 family peptidase [Pseudonocardiaceae bacterium YIM PH 21723]|nr:M4 family peptidase [Pseudonocardiaceae bacterium YIM PH 21723]